MIEIRKVESAVGETEEARLLKLAVGTELADELAFKVDAFVKPTEISARPEELAERNEYAVTVSSSKKVEFDDFVKDQDKSDKLESASEYGVAADADDDDLHDGVELNTEVANEPALAEATESSVRQMESGGLKEQDASSSEQVEFDYAVQDRATESDVSPEESGGLNELGLSSSEQVEFDNAVQDHDEPEKVENAFEDDMVASVDNEGAESTVDNEGAESTDEAVEADTEIADKNES